MDTSFLWAIMFPVISSAPGQYHGAAVKTQEALYKQSDVKQLSDQSSSAIAKDHPVAAAVAAVGYQVGYKKEISFKTKLTPIVTGVELKTQYNINKKASSLGFSIPF